MSQSYDILALIRFSHDYFGDSQERRFKLYPVSSTKYLMDKNDIKLINSHARLQLTVATERAGNNVKLSYKVDNAIDLYFLIKSEDLYLDNYSVLPQRNKQEVMFFSGKLVDKKNTNTLRMESDKVIEFAKNTLNIPTALVDDIKVLDLHDNEYQISSYTNEDQRYQLDISSLEPAIYKLNTKIGIKYFTNLSTGMGSKPWGLLHIDTGQCLTEDGLLNSQIYEISINSLSTYWKYIISDKQVAQFSEIDALTIEASDGSIAFEKQFQEGALTFTSGIPITLTAKKKISFRLKKKNGQSTQASVLIQNLPLPNPKTMINKDKDKLFSPIFIKL